MVEFEKIYKIEHLSYRMQERLLKMPKSDSQFLLQMIDGDRRSGRTTRLSVFYADMLINRGYVRTVDHVIHGSDMELHKRDVMLSRMVIKEMESRGYHFGIPRHKDQVGKFFHNSSHPAQTPCLVMTTDDHVADVARCWKESIAFCAAISNFMERI